MPALLYALLTAPVAQAATKVSPFVEALQSPEKAAFFITVVGGSIIGVIVTAVVKIGKARRELAMAAADVPVAPKLPSLRPKPDEALLARLAAVEKEAADARALWRHHDAEQKLREAVADLQVKSDALVRERAERAIVEQDCARLRADSAAKDARIAELEQKGLDLVVEMSRLRMQGPPSLPPLPKGRGRER